MRQLLDWQHLTFLPPKMCQTSKHRHFIKLRMLTLKTPVTQSRVFSNYSELCFSGGKWISYICMLICCRVMMLMMSVAISCCRVIAGSRSFSSQRMLGAAEDSDTDLGDSDERQRDSTRLKLPKIYITVSSLFLSSFSPLHLPLPRASDLNSSLFPVIQ